MSGLQETAEGVVETKQEVETEKFAGKIGYRLVQCRKSGEKWRCLSSSETVVYTLL